MKPVLTLALAAPGYDCPSISERLARAFSAIERTGIPTLGPRTPVASRAELRRVISAHEPSGMSGALILAATGFEPVMAMEVAEAYSTRPLAIWAFPEQRGAAPLDSFLGLWRAAHLLARNGMAIGWLYAHAEASHIVEFLRHLSAPAMLHRSRQRLARPLEPALREKARRLRPELDLDTAYGAPVPPGTPDPLDDLSIDLARAIAGEAILADLTDLDSGSDSGRLRPLGAPGELPYGRVTFFRLSRARNRPAMVIGTGSATPQGEALGILFKGGIAPALAMLIDEGIEGRLAIMAGEHRDLVEAWAGERGLPILDLTA